MHMIKTKWLKKTDLIKQEICNYSLSIPLQSATESCHVTLLCPKSRKAESRHFTDLNLVSDVYAP